MTDTQIPAKTLLPKAMRRKTWALGGACMAGLVAASVVTLAQTPPAQPSGQAVPVPPPSDQDDFAKRIKGEEPLRGSEAALRHQIEAFEQGHPDLNAMNERLATATVPQVPKIEREFARMGQLQSLTFLGVGFSGWDVYVAKFPNGVMISRIMVTPDSKISGLLFQWGP